MPLSGIRLADLTRASLASLVENGVREGRRLEYKELVGTDDEAKREFLADVSSFANASGGDLIVGIKDSDGVASELVGVDNANVDSEKCASRT